MAGILVATGCQSQPPASSATPTEASPTASITIPMGPDGPELPEEVVAALQAYGAEHADEFGGLYVEDQSRASFVMLFTDRLEEHAAALAEIWPRVTVRGVRFTEAALTEVLEGFDLQAMAADGIEPLSAGLDTINNRVTLDLKSDDPTLEARLELRYGGMVEVTVHPLPGAWSNAMEGDGWRLLAAGEAGPAEAYTVRAATDAAAWEALWSALALEGEQPEVALEDEVVVSFAHGIGSSCPELRLDEVVINGGVVFSVVSDPLAPEAAPMISPGPQPSLSRSIARDYPLTVSRFSLASDPSPGRAPASPRCSTSRCPELRRRSGQQRVVDHAALRAGGGQEAEPLGQRPGLGQLGHIGGVVDGVDLAVSIDDQEPVRGSPVSIGNAGAPVPGGERIGMRVERPQVAVDRRRAGHDDDGRVHPADAGRLQEPRGQSIADPGIPEPRAHPPRNVITAMTSIADDVDALESHDRPPSVTGGHHGA
jgi:hypothetical protein